ncbi:hypothetical protein ACFWIB_28190 [Streptomyces sp. NPDC127051]|uniref:hypothetical protein n=1 Tax=Streptomyces sp. NPDC127051 TaxID=3347119 RepID=UPI00364C9CE1
MAALPDRPHGPAEAIARRAGFPEGPGQPASGAGEETVRELLLRGKAIGVKTSPTIVVGGEAPAGAHAPAVIAELLPKWPRA